MLKIPGAAFQIYPAPCTAGCRVWLPSLAPIAARLKWRRPCGIRTSHAGRLNSVPAEEPTSVIADLSRG